jgi:hypothetical protein
MPKLLSLSERRRRTARANGAKSRGPITAAGKARSSRNALKHGFRSNAVLPEELPPDYAENAQKLISDWNLTSPHEFALAQDWALSCLRMKQLFCMEGVAFRDEIANLPDPSDPNALGQAFVNLVNDGTLPLLCRYEGTWDTRWYRALTQLSELKYPKATRRRKIRQVPNEPTTASTPITSISSPAISTRAALLNAAVPNEPTKHLTRAAAANSSQFAPIARAAPALTEN